MHKLIPVSVLIAATAVFYDAAIAAQLRFAPPQDHAWTTDASGYRDTILLGGGMGGMTGGMGNVPGGGMTGMSGRGMGDTTGYGTPSAGGDPYGSSQTATDPPPSTQYYHCVTQHGQCSVSSTPGTLRSGASCACLLGGKGK